VNAAWAVVAAALGASFLTILGTFWLERWRMARAVRADNNDRLRGACVRLAGHAQAFMMRCHGLYLTSVMRSGIGEGIDVTFHYRKPADPMAFTEWLLEDLNPMWEAQSLIEITGDRDLIRAGADVITAATNVLAQATAITESRVAPPRARMSVRLRFWLRSLVPLRRSSEVERATLEAVRDLARKLRQFARLTRERLGVDDPNDVIAAFPQLFAQSEVAVPNTQAANSGQTHADAHADA